MFRNVMLSVVFSALFIANCHANSTHVLQMGSGYAFELPAHDPQVFSNIFMWDVTAECTLLGKADNYRIAIKALRKKGAINGRKIAAGETLELSFRAKDKMTIMAAAGAAVELTNLNDIAASVECYIS